MSRGVSWSVRALLLIGIASLVAACGSQSVTVTVTGHNQAHSTIPGASINPGGTRTTSTSTAAAQPVRPTQEIIYSPISASGKLLVSVSRTVSGSCQGSIVLFRSDAWRCFLSNGATVDGGNILDPCFSSPGTSVLYCVLNPLAHSAVEVDANAPLTDGNSPTESDTSDLPWYIVLTSGASCEQLTGAGTLLDGMRQNYSCPDGVTLYGAPSKKSQVWTIFGVEKSSTNLTERTVRAVYY